MMRKKLTAALLTVSILSTAFSLSVSSQEEKPQTSAGSIEKVTYIVTLDSNSLIDIAINSNGQYSNVADILLSDKAEMYVSQIQSVQEQMKAKIQSAVPQADFSDSTSYNAIFSGFTVEAPSDALPIIESVAGVKGVSVSKQIEIIKQDNDSLTLHQKSKLFTDEINAKYAYDNGYTGKGILIADIDASFDLSHEVFSTAPPEQKYSKNDMTILYENSGFNTNSSYGIDDVYKSSKVVFAYDYGEDDADTYLQGEDHGTHTAGIAAGNNGQTDGDQFRGVAYDAQFALMKISDSQGQLSSYTAVLSACDDSVKLGADVVNCSFGENRGAITSEYAEAFEKMQEIDIMVCGAQANESINGQAFFDLMQTPFDAGWIDYSTNGDIAAFPHTLAVGSVNLRNQYANTFLIGDRTVFYNNAVVEYVTGYTEETDDFFNSISAGTEYVYINGVGLESDYRDVNVQNKIVIINRGTIPFFEKMETAVQNGALGVIVVNDEPGIFAPEINEPTIPLILADISIKDYLLENPTGTIGNSTGLVVVDSGSTDVSVFSSSGVSADLRLTPQIVAPGASIYSSVSDNRYEFFEGTSMATPNITGCAAIVKQKLNEVSPNGQKRASVFSLLTSKSNPLPYGDGVYYSPRVQGSGMVDLQNTLKTNQTITVNGEEKAIANLKDNTSGSYSFTFNVVNDSDNAVTYNLSYAVQTDKGEKVDGKNVNTFEPVSIADKTDVTFSDENGTAVNAVSLEANETKTISVNIKLHDDFISANNSIFTNGFYVDGFVFLTPNDDASSSLHVTFMGFCGDWSAIPLFDNTAYDNEEAVFPIDSALMGVNVSALYQTADYDDNNYESLSIVGLGHNPISGEVHSDKISFGRATLKNGGSLYSDEYVSDNVCIIPSFYMYRDAYNAELSIADANGNQLVSVTGDIITANYVSSTPFANTTQILYDYDTETLNSYATEFFKTLPDGQYSITLSGEIMDSDGTTKNRQSKTYTFYFDNVNPTVEKHEIKTSADGKKTLEVTVKDNVAAMGSDLLVKDPNYEGEYVSIDEYFLYYLDLDFDSFDDDEYPDNYESDYGYNAYKKLKMSSLSDLIFGDDELEPYAHLTENADGTVTVSYDITDLADILSEHGYETDVVIRGMDYAYNFSDDIVLSLATGQSSQPQESKNSEISGQNSTKTSEISTESKTSEISKQPIGEVKNSSNETGTAVKNENIQKTESTVVVSSADTANTGDNASVIAVVFAVVASSGAVMLLKKRKKS